ncbi:hypothetical protein Nepgr_001523 [Nepenthes gracilis]|uniref:Uncharacterized protein n=1 Tax=Nepenthes gracilis TaxID=150966 RepID=A0AAD3P4K6_NEPGR|nr:hypothetical protein Nepgr_001523 [Nepenthes gracilis]
MALGCSGRTSNKVLLVKSPSEDCSEVPSDPFTRQATKVSLTSNNGIVDPIRTVNPLGFMIREPLPECPECCGHSRVAYICGLHWRMDEDLV